MNQRGPSLLLLLPILSLSCNSAPPTPPTSAPIIGPQAGQQKFENQADGISFMYPAGWKVTSTDSTQFKFIQTGKGEAMELILDVPKLPWNPLGWIPIDKVRDGYVDDVKKRMIGAQVNQLPDPAVPDARQHRVLLTGQIDKKPAVNDAVLLVHGDRVYILSVETDPGSYPQLKKSLENAVSTITWMK